MSAPNSHPYHDQHAYQPDPTFFYEAFRSTPSPPPATSFLDSILNPVESQSHNSLGYLPIDPAPSRTDMPGPQRNRRPTRLPNGYVDLTGTSASPEAPRHSRPPSPTPGPSAKRRKPNDGTSGGRTSKTPEVAVDEIDLSTDKQTVQNMLQKPREEAVKAQQKPEETATTFNTFTCVICMDTPTDLTATACGHLFCHTCLMEALIAGENRAAPGEPKRSQCPVCRKILNRTKASDIIPLMLKKGLATQPRKRSAIAVVIPKVSP